MHLHDWILEGTLPDRRGEMRQLLSRFPPAARDLGGDRGWCWPGGRIEMDPRAIDTPAEAALVFCHEVSHALAGATVDGDHGVAFARAAAALQRRLVGFGMGDMGEEGEGMSRYDLGGRNTSHTTDAEAGRFALAFAAAPTMELDELYSRHRPPLIMMALWATLAALVFVGMVHHHHHPYELWNWLANPWTWRAAGIAAVAGCAWLAVRD